MWCLAHSKHSVNAGIILTKKKVTMSIYWHKKTLDVGKEKEIEKAQSPHFTLIDLMAFSGTRAQSLRADAEADEN